jgi:hypothetical protein
VSSRLRLNQIRLDSRKSRTFAKGPTHAATRGKRMRTPLAFAPSLNAELTHSGPRDASIATWTAVSGFAYLRSLLLFSTYPNGLQAPFAILFDKHYFVSEGTAVSAFIVANESNLIGC